MATIPESWHGIKGGLDGWLAEWGMAAIVIAACLASFGLGRYSALEDSKTAVIVSERISASKVVPRSLGGMYVASREGKTYSYPWCSGVNRILPANRVWYSTADQARAAGYEPAKNCTGLE